MHQNLCITRKKQEQGRKILSHSFRHLGSSQAINPNLSSSDHQICKFKVCKPSIKTMTMKALESTQRAKPRPPPCSR